MVKISFPVRPELGAGIVGESLWAEQVGRDRYRLANIPFNVHGVSYHDVVFGRRRRTGVLAFAGVSLRGGHSTCWIARRVEAGTAAFRDRWAPLRELGCGYESAGPLHAIDVPPSADFAIVEALLEAGFAAGVWDYEIAHRAHALADGEEAAGRSGR
jgi:hypothetical protein